MFTLQPFPGQLFLESSCCWTNTSVNNTNLLLLLVLPAVPRARVAAGGQPVKGGGEVLRRRGSGEVPGRRPKDTELGWVRLGQSRRRAGTRRWWRWWWRGRGEVGVGRRRRNYFFCFVVISDLYIWTLFVCLSAVSRVLFTAGGRGLAGRRGLAGGPAVQREVCRRGKKRKKRKKAPLPVESNGPIFTHLNILTVAAPRFTPDEAARRSPLATRSVHTLDILWILVLKPNKNKKQRGCVTSAVGPPRGFLCVMNPCGHFSWHCLWEWLN